MSKPETKPKPQKARPSIRPELHLKGADRFKAILKRAVPPAATPSKD